MQEVQAETKHSEDVSMRQAEENAKTKDHEIEANARAKIAHLSAKMKDSRDSTTLAVLMNEVDSVKMKARTAIINAADDIKHAEKATLDTVEQQASMKEEKLEEHEAKTEVAQEELKAAAQANVQRDEEQVHTVKALIKRITNVQRTSDSAYEQLLPDESE